MSSPEKIPLLYIIGAGRSGSTVLDTVLGNHPDILSCGELINLPKSAWINNEYCACGCPGRECPFWSEVRREWQRTTESTVRELLQLQEKFERTKTWGLPVRRKHDTRSTEFQRYREMWVSLCRAAQKISGKSVILDSSKTPTRAFYLTQIPEIDLHLIHLVRDGRGVCYSLTKPYAKDTKSGIQAEIRPRSAIRTAFFWVFRNWQSEKVRSLLGQDLSIRIRYEDFMSTPADTMKQIEKLSHIDLTRITAKLAAEEPFDVGHTIAGNRVRMSGAIKLRADQKWQRRLSRKKRLVFELVAKSGLKKYGYA